MIEILEARFAAVTDLGRFDGPPVGLSVNGALDQLSARVANILVGNAGAAPLIEATASAVELVADAPLLVAATGPGVVVSVNGVPAPASTPVSVEAGQRVRIEPGEEGLRAYLAIRGGVEAPVLFGSCAPDSMIGFGLLLAPGTALRERTPTEPLRNPHLGGALFRFFPPTTAAGPEAVIDVTDGPDEAEFAGTVDRLFAEPFVVGPRRKHVGLRLAGRPPQRSSTAEVLSRGVPVGAVEVPSDRELLLLHRGRGVTAGYPVLAVLTGTALDRMAQARPGDAVRFRLVDLDDAEATSLDRHLAVRRFRERCWNALAENGVAELGIGAIPRDAAPTTP